MKQEFEQLASQAGMLRDKYGLYWNAHDNFDDGVDLEKFAELIVRECANIVADAVDHREPASTYVGKIKQHFGVES